MACAAPLLATLEYSFDEGVYIWQARAIVAGQLPYRDFFCHQTPLYPLTLAVVSALAPDSLLWLRLPSLLALALTGVLVHASARRLGASAIAAALATLLFYSAPLQFYDLTALPYALMLLCATAGLYAVWFGEGRARAGLGGLLFALAILYKPVALGAALAVGVALVFRADGWPRVLWASAAGSLALILAWAIFDVLSQGAFTELLRLQVGRHVAGGGFELLQQFPGAAGAIERRGIGSAEAWNLYQHRHTFLARPLANPHLILVALAATGQVLLWRSRGRAPARERALLTLWWVVPLLFAVFVWEPAWQAYFVQYLPAWSVLAALALDALWDSVRARTLLRGAAVGVVGLACAAGVGQALERRYDYAQVPRADRPDEAWLLFDPFLNFVSGTQPACGLIDPFNVYGVRSLTALAAPEQRSRFHVTRAQLIDCLEADPEIRIGIGYFGTWFVDDALAAYLDGLPDARFVPMRLHYRPAGGAQPPSLERLRRR